MCYFITCFIPTTAKFELVAAEAEENGLIWSEIENSYLTMQLDTSKEKYRYFYTTKGMCDCQSAIGIQHRMRRKNTTASTNAINRKIKGWSEAKVKRWLEQKMASEDKLAYRSPQGVNEISRWITFISGVLNNEFSKKVGVLLHFYSKNVHDEVLNLRNSIDIKNVTEKDLLNIETDRVYFFSK